MSKESNVWAEDGHLTVAGAAISIRGGVSGVSGWVGGRGRGCVTWDEGRERTDKQRVMRGREDR